MWLNLYLFDLNLLLSTQNPLENSHLFSVWIDKIALFLNNAMECILLDTLYIKESGEGHRRGQKRG